MTTTTHQGRLSSLTVFIVTSVLIHALLLCIPLSATIVPDAAVPQNRLIAIELLSLIESKKIQQKRKEDTPPPQKRPAPLKTIMQKTEPAPPQVIKKTDPVRVKEATVSLDRLSELGLAYREYNRHLDSAIRAVWEARNKTPDGKVTVRIFIARNGHLAGLHIISSSGNQIIDDEALRIIRTAAPFNPLPPEFNDDEFSLTSDLFF